MQQLKQEKMKHFLKKNYYSLSVLAKMCGVSQEDVIKLQTAQCIPGHSYITRTVDIFSSPVADDYIASSNTRYYHPYVVEWVKDSLLALSSDELVEKAKQVKEHFAMQLECYFKGVRTPGCQNFDQAWSYWINGTWGICLKKLTVECMSKKELSRFKIAQIMEKNPDTIGKSGKDNLTCAIRSYIEASMEFPPYGIRHELALDAINKFGLSMTLDSQYLGDK